jgi:hypothetical protein
LQFVSPVAAQLLAQAFPEGRTEFFALLQMTCGLQQEFDVAIDKDDRKEEKAISFW